MSEEFRLSDLQERVLMLPEHYDLFLGGGRGGGKSTAVATLILRHMVQHGSRARALFLRQSYRGAEDFTLLTQELYPQAVPGARFNSVERLWRFPGGGVLEIGQMANHADYGKHQGRSFSLIVVDEVGQYPTPTLIDMLRSNLRAPEEVPCRFVLVANPAGIGHGWISRRHVLGREPWKPYEDKHGRTWVTVVSTVADNPFLDSDAYRQQLEAACSGDKALLEAWLSGNWSVVRGAFFEDVLSESRVGVSPWPSVPKSRMMLPHPQGAMGQVRPRYTVERWRTYLAHDWGSAQPSVTLLIAESPGGEAFGQWYPRGSRVVVDEYATCDGEHLDRGLGQTVPETAAGILAMCEKWEVRPVGVADDACFNVTGASGGSIAAEFARCGVRFKRAQKGARLAGWQTLRRMLADAGSQEKPGAYISRGCNYLWQTLPTLARDPRRPEDLDTRQNDHGADALRYGVAFDLPRYLGPIKLGWIS